jgi:hypothetical protein
LPKDLQYLKRFSRKLTWRISRHRGRRHIRAYRRGSSIQAARKPPPEDTLEIYPPKTVKEILSQFWSQRHIGRKCAAPDLAEQQRGRKHGILQGS